MKITYSKSKLQALDIAAMVAMFLIVFGLIVLASAFLFMVAWNAVVASLFEGPKLNIWTSLAVMFLLHAVRSLFVTRVEKREEV